MEPMMAAALGLTNAQGAVAVAGETGEKRRRQPDAHRGGDHQEGDGHGHDTRDRHD